MMTYRQIPGKQQGVTLIELMLALVISSVLMLGVSTVYVAGKRGYNIQDSLARQQENSRFAMDILMRDLRMAGYLPSARQGLIDELQPFDLNNTADGGGDASDTVVIRYESTTDCLDQPTPANSCGSMQCAINRYFIDGDNNLACLGNGGGMAEVIAEGVSNMQILYGIDTDTDGIANKYAIWSNLSDTERRNDLVSIRIALLTNTTDEVRNVDTNKTVQVLDRSIAISDKRIHRTYSNTIVLRNH